MLRLLLQLKNRMIGVKTMFLLGEFAFLPDQIIVFLGGTYTFFHVSSTKSSMGFPLSSSKAVKALDCEAASLLFLGAIPTITAADAKIASKKWPNTLRNGITEHHQKPEVECELCKGPHYTKDCPLKEEGNTLEEAYYTQFRAPYQPATQYRVARPGFYQRNNGNSLYPDQRQKLEESLTKFMVELAKRHKENSNIIKEI
nr:hypothetical protein [Tanacetum cinerariifolium]